MPRPNSLMNALGVMRKVCFFLMTMLLGSLLPVLASRYHVIGTATEIEEIRKCKGQSKNDFVYSFTWNGEPTWEQARLAKKFLKEVTGIEPGKVTIEDHEMNIAMTVNNGYKLPFRFMTKKPQHVFQYTVEGDEGVLSQKDLSRIAKCMCALETHLLGLSADASVNYLSDSLTEEVAIVISGGKKYGFAPLSRLYHVGNIYTTGDEYVEFFADANGTSNELYQSQVAIRFRGGEEYGYPMYLDGYRSVPSTQE